MLAAGTWSANRGSRIALGVSSGAAARLLSSLTSLLALPLAVRYLGPERFGVWATIASTVVFLNLLDLGIAGTLTNHIARSYALGDHRDAARSVANALVLSVAAATVGGLALCAVWPGIDWSGLLRTSGNVSRSEVRATAAVAAALMLLGLPSSLASRIFAGYQELHLNNLVVAIGTVVNLTGLVAGIALRVPMPLLFTMAVGGTTLCNLAALVGILTWHKPWLRPRLSWIEWPVARELLSSGSGFLLIQIAAAVVFSSDNVVVSHYLGPAQVTPYNVLWRVVGLAAVAQSFIFPALWPAYTEAYSLGDYAWMRRAFRLVMRGTLALNVTFAVLLLVAGRPVIRWCAGEAAVPSISLLATMALWAVISGCMTAESCLLAAVNRIRVQGVLSVIAAIVNLALSIVLVQRIGAVGVIAGTVVSYLLVLVVPQSLLVGKVLRGAASATGHEQRHIYKNGAHVSRALQTNASRG